MSYVLTTSANSVNENSNVNIKLFTSGLTNGTLVPYSISGTGITVSDFNSLSTLTGNFVINDNLGQITINPKNDLLTEFAEDFTVSLTGPGRTESITVTINDTSRTTTNIIGQFYVTAPTLSVAEGENAIFDIRATNVTPGTAVAYSIFGISSSDLINPGLITGTISMAPTGNVNETNARVVLPILFDNVTEGPESIILLLSPDFPYTLEVSSTITVIDTSINRAPQFFLNTNKTSLIEGDNVRITLNTVNIADGAIVPFRIVSQIPGAITISDFTGLASLDGFFPPVSGNTTNVVLFTRDDFIFEPTELFYVTVPDDANTRVYAATPLIRLLDSGNTLVDADSIFTGNATISFLDKAVLKPNLSSLVKTEPFWKDTTGLLSEDMVLQGKLPFATASDPAFYHPFSYVIRSTVSIEDWRNSIKSFLHPAGLTIFSEINNETRLNELLSVETKAVEDSIIKITDIITVDEADIYASNTIWSGSNTLTVDAVTLSINL